MFAVSDYTLPIDRGEKNMNMNLFNGMFGKIAPGMCRIGMNGEIAIKTTGGYKSYNSKTGRLTNCDNFAFDIGEDMFFVIPTNHVRKDDIILAAGRPCCVVEVGKNEIRAFRYEDSTIINIVPEHHIFMGKQYFYGKIVSLFGNMMGGKGGMKNMFKYMMFGEMMKGMNGSNSGNSFANMMPMMFMMNGGGENLFDGMFDVDFDDDEEEEEVVEEDK